MKRLKFVSLNYLALSFINSTAVVACVRDVEQNDLICTKEEWKSLRTVARPWTQWVHRLAMRVYIFTHV